MCGPIGNRLKPMPDTGQRSAVLSVDVPLLVLRSARAWAAANPEAGRPIGPTGCPAQRLADAGKRIGFQGDSCTLSVLGLDKSDFDVMLGGRIVGVADHFSRDAIAVFLWE